MQAEGAGRTPQSGSDERQRADAPARPARSRWLSRALAGLRWAAPGVGLALIPKCPMCVAGYIALGTGLSVSFPVAEGLRTGMFVACFAALGWLIVAKVRRHAGRAQAQRCC